MGVIKFILVILLCVPVAFILWCFFNNLVFNIRKQQEKAERLRRNKEMFQETSLDTVNRSTTIRSKSAGIKKKKKVIYIKPSKRRSNK